MRRPFAIVIVCCCAFLSFMVLVHFSVFARRTVKDLASSQDGSSGTAGDCSDQFPTPFAAVLNGQVTPTDPDSSNPPSCTGFTGAGPYPNYSLALSAPDKSFTLTVTPVLWGGGNAQSTILHLEFSSTTTTLSLQSFVVSGLAITGQTNASGPSYVACDFAQGAAPTNLYILEAVANNQNSSLVACTQPTMEAASAPPGTLGFASAIQPTPIQFADTNTTRWDIDGLNGSANLPATLPSVDLYVPGVPNDLVTELGVSGLTNNLTSSFMANQSNFLAVAFDSSANKTVLAGGLSITNVTTALTNDSISTPTIVDPIMAISSGGFTDQVNIVGATPQENSDGTFLNPATNPADPTLSGTTCFGGGADSQIFRTVWYSFTPIGDGTVAIDTAKSRFDTVLAIYTGQPGSLDLVACDDNIVDKIGITHLQAMLGNVQVSHGTQYLVLVGESPTQSGLLNDSSNGNPVVPSKTVAAPLSNDATLFLSVVETPTAAAIGLSPSSGTALAFGNQQVGVPSASQKIVVTSNGGTPLTISNIAVPAGFTFTTTCNSPLDEGLTCEIDVALNPTATGPVSGNLTFGDNVNGSSPSYPLTGTGVDFMFPTPPTTTGTLTPTTGAAYNLSVSGSAGFNNPVSFACSGLPTNTQCVFSPNPATPGANSTPVMLTVSRVSNTAALISSRVLVQASGGIATLLLFLLRGRRRKAFAVHLVFGLVLSSVLFVSSCGGGGGGRVVIPPPSPGSYPFTATATSSGHSAPSINLTLTVQ
jgi:hypothetical protein